MKRIAVAMLNQPTAIVRSPKQGPVSIASIGVRVCLKVIHEIVEGRRSGKIDAAYEWRKEKDEEEGQMPFAQVESSPLSGHF